jgi:hypothetical protein
MDLKSRKARNLTGDGNTEPHATMNGYFRPSGRLTASGLHSARIAAKVAGAETGAVQVIRIPPVSM